HIHGFPSDFLIVDADRHRHLDRLVLSVVVNARDDPSSICPGETGLFHADTVNADVVGHFNPEVDILSFHIAANDALAARSIPAVTLKVRDDDELLLTRTHLTQGS